VRRGVAARWRCFQVRTAPGDVERAAALLHAATGALTSAEAKPGNHDIIVSAYVPARGAAQIARRVSEILEPLRMRAEQSDVAEEEWERAWKRFYRPFKIATKTYVAPNWERGFRPPPGSNVLWLDPGMAFGTGLHDSTRLAMALLLQHVRPKRVVLDLGCGSGILGLAAAQCGATVYSSDTDPIAVQATKRNFEVNGLRAAAILRARGTPASFPEAHLIAANITAAVLMRLAKPFARKLRARGILVASGFSQRSAGSLNEAFEHAGLRRVESLASGPWRAYAYRKA